MTQRSKQKHHHTIQEKIDHYVDIANEISLEIKKEEKAILQTYKTDSLSLVALEIFLMLIPILNSDTLTFYSFIIIAAGIIKLHYIRKRILFFRKWRRKAIDLILKVGRQLRQLGHRLRSGKKRKTIKVRKKIPSPVVNGYLAKISAKTGINVDFIRFFFFLFTFFTGGLGVWIYYLLLPWWADGDGNKENKVGYEHWEYWEF